MEFIVKKTTELSPSEMEEISSLFAAVFEGKEKSVGTFREEYLNTTWGYSLHGLMKDEGRIVGAHSLVPVKYMVDDRETVWMFSGDTMVKKEYRNFLNILDLFEVCGTVARDDYGVALAFSFPNDNSYELSVKGYGSDDIGKLNTYALPYRVGGVRRKFRSLNWLSVFLCRTLVFLSRLQCSSKPAKYRIDKDRSEFYDTRLKWFDGQYMQGMAGNCQFVYRIQLHEGVRTAFIIDMDKVSPRGINGAVRHILRNHSREIDVILYVGRLPFRPLSLVKLPRRLEPKHFHFVGAILDKKKIDKDLVLDIDNWNVNLSCYDLL